MQVLVDWTSVPAILLAGVIFEPVDVKRTPAGRASRRALSAHESVGGNGGLALHRRGYRR